MATYSEIRDQLGTGDVVLFSGKGGISNLIKNFTRSKWSHVGMVLCIPESDMVLLWESTTLSNIADLDTHRITKGVQLVPFSQRLQRYEGTAAVRQLAVNRKQLNLDGLSTFRSEMKGRPYEKSEAELFKAAYDGWGGKNEEDFSSLFCSELVAGAYQAMGLLPKPANKNDKAVLPANEYTPKDFSDEARQPLGLLLGATLGPQVPVSA